MHSEPPVVAPVPGARPSSLLQKVAAVVGASWLILIGGVAIVAGAGALVVHLATPALSPALPVIPAFHETRVEVVPTPDVVLAVHSLGRLETESYHLERVVDLTDHQTQLFGLVKAKDGILLVAVGDVVAGVDLERLSAGDVDTDWSRRSVTLRLPPPSVFSAKLDEQATRVYSRTTDLLAAHHEDLESRARAEAARTMEKAAVDQGLLDRARADAERAMTGLLRSIGFSDVHIEWKQE
jgi:Protein of unknown function (DUF4230)